MYSVIITVVRAIEQCLIIYFSVLSFVPINSAVNATYVHVGIVLKRGGAWCPLTMNVPKFSAVLFPAQVLFHRVSSV